MRYRIKRPSPGILVIEPFAEDEMTSGGLWIPATAQREGAVMVGTVRHINPPVSHVSGETDPDDYFKVGEVVVCGKWQGTDFKLDPRGPKLVLVNEDAVLTTLEPDDDSTTSAN